MKRRLLKTLISLCLLTQASAATAQTALIFERAEIRIEAPLTADSDTPAHPPYKYTVELRPEDALRLEYIHTLNTLTTDTGVMIAFAAPTIVALPPMNVYTAVDAIFIAEDGTILQITPNITLGEMTQEVKARAPVKAFLFLKAGEAAAQKLQPRDIVYGRMFTPAPPRQE